QFAQGRFSGAVLADQRMNLAGQQVEIGLGECGNTAICLGRIAQADDRLACHDRTLPLARRRISPLPLLTATMSSFQTAASLMACRRPLARDCADPMGRNWASDSINRP